MNLIVLIAIAVVLQSKALHDGPVNALIFVTVVFAAHRGLAQPFARSKRVRRLVRGAPRPLVRDGVVAFDALHSAAKSYGTPEYADRSEPPMRPTVPTAVVAEPMLEKYRNPSRVSREQ